MSAWRQRRRGAGSAFRRLSFSHRNLRSSRSCSILPRCCSSAANASPRSCAGSFPLCVPMASWPCSFSRSPTWARRACLRLHGFRAVFRGRRARRTSRSRSWPCTVPLVALTVVASPYQRARIFAFLDPWKDPQNTGFHIVQSLLALGSGGIFGVGLGASRAKFFYLPEQYTDFIFSVLGEELGLIGAIAVVVLFVVLAYRAVRIALGRSRSLRIFLGVGCTALIVDSSLHQHRRRDVVVAGDRRAASVRLLRRQLARRESGSGRADRQRRTPPPPRMPAIALFLPAGGTGGHLYPAIAIADALRERRANDRVHRQRRPARSKDRSGSGLRDATPFRAGRWRASSSLERFANRRGQCGRNVAKLCAACCACARIVLVATGGYVCFPVGARRTRAAHAGSFPYAPIALLEINANPGLTNRLLAPLVDEVWGAFGDADSRLPAKYVRTGIPVRASLRALPPRDARRGSDSIRAPHDLGHGRQPRRARRSTRPSPRSSTRRELPRGWQIVARQRRARLRVHAGRTSANRSATTSSACRIWTILPKRMRWPTSLSRARAHPRWANWPRRASRRFSCPTRLPPTTIKRAMPQRLPRRGAPLSIADAGSRRRPVVVDALARSDGSGAIAADAGGGAQRLRRRSRCDHSRAGRLLTARKGARAMKQGPCISSASAASA